QLNAKQALWKANPQAKELVKRCRELLDKLDALEGELHNPKAKITYDLLAQRGGTQLYSQLSYLLGAVMESDNAPTQRARDMHAKESQRLRRQDSLLKQLLAQDLKKLNELALRLGIPDIVVHEPAKAKG